MSFTIQIDKSSPIPIFRQLEEQILQHIHSGELKPGDRIPSQYELSRWCGVSRATVQKAIDHLVMEELLYYQQGKGIYVALPSERQRLPILQSIGHSLRLLGHDVQADLLLIEQIEALHHVAEALELSPATSVIHVKRLQYVDGEPMLLQEAYLEAARFPELIEHDLRRRALTEIIETLGGIRLVGSSLAIGSRDANWEESRTLSVQAGASLLTLEEIDYDEDDKPVRYSRNKLRSDRFRVVARTAPEAKISLEYRLQPGTVNIDLS